MTGGGWPTMYSFRLMSFLLVLLLYTCQASTLGERTLPELDANSITTLISTPDPIKQLDPSNPSSHLSKILIPRVSDTENNTIVRDYIVSTLKALQWHIDIDDFTDKTPIGTKRFRNIIATKDPTATRRVILSAHYDSKYSAVYPDNQFVGAIDSAAPCAMLLDLAEALNPLLEQRKKRLDEGLEDDEDVADTTLQLVFFDGEEAFVYWTATDSIYGARHLADKWASTYISPHDKRRLMGVQSTEMAGIEHLILLDLLGAPQPLIRSYYLDTAWLFDAFVSVERRLGESGAFAYGEEKEMAPGKWTSYFMERSEGQMNMGYIGDDHVPFLEKGVSVLHFIPEPFPHVWHTLKDDATALDIPTMRRWNIMLRVFMSEYLHLRPEEAHPPHVLSRSASELG
ncbi:glutaminyl-peptide cyclotransferase-like protein [Lyophyllum atratum]|nr:glutaminyl-peptide cyclotransferase-like protein [Lyophyllum atratum]